MKFEVNKLRADEIEINIGNIVKQCVKRIGIIVACAVAFAVIVPCLVYVNDLNNYNNRVENPVEIELSDSEQLGVERYNLLKSKVEQLKNYGEDALVLKLDYENVYQGRLQFYVNAEEEAQFDIAYVISNYVNSGALAEDLYGKENIDYTSYADELFGAEVSGASSGVPSGVVNFRVWASSEEECLRYLAISKEALNEFSKELNSKIAEHSLEVVEERVIEGYVTEVDNKQTNYIEKLQTAIENLDAHVATLNETQLQVIQNEESNASDEPMEAVKPSFSIKFAIIGLVLGGVAAVGVIVLYVIFGGKLQTEQELLRRFNISHFGSLKSKGDSKKLDIVSARLTAHLENAEKKEIAFIGTAKELFADEMVELQKALKERGIKCELIGNVLTDKDAFEKMKNQKSVVLVETIGKSAVKEVYEESMVCIDSQVEVIGYISIIE